MIFIHEFEIKDKERREEDLSTYKHSGQVDIGNKIAESFGWEVTGIGRLIRADDGNPISEVQISERFTLKIDAFPSDKWASFKSELIYFYENKGIGPALVIQELIDKLESYGKKRTITNNK